MFIQVVGPDGCQEDEWTLRGTALNMSSFEFDQLFDPRFSSHKYPCISPPTLSRAEIVSATCTQTPLTEKLLVDVGLAKARASRCSLHKSSTMWSLKSAGGEMSVFSFTVPTWFMNEQPPGSRDQPTSSANQPATGCLPVQMCSQCTLCSCRGQRAHAAPVVCPKIPAEGSTGVVHLPRVYLLWCSGAVLAHFAHTSFRWNMKMRVKLWPWNLCFQPFRFMCIPTPSTPPETTWLLGVCRVKGLWVRPGVSAADWAVESGQQIRLQKDEGNQQGQ